MTENIALKANRYLKILNLKYFYLKMHVLVKPKFLKFFTYKFQRKFVQLFFKFFFFVNGKIYILKKKTKMIC